MAGPTDPLETRVAALEAALEALSTKERSLGLSLIATQTLALAGTFTFPAAGVLPTVYQHLLLLGKVRSARAATFDNLGLRFNGDGLGNYGFSVIQNLNSTLTGASSINATYAVGPVVDAANSSANAYSGVGVLIPNYRDAYFKAVCAMNNQNIGATSLATTIIQAIGSTWRSTAAITSIVISGFNAGSNFVAGSTLSLYGVRG